jgi:glucose-6-phosphate isomerase
MTALAGLGPLEAATAGIVDDLVARRAVQRMFDGDHTLWQDDPTEVADRLGWIPVVDESRGALRGLRADVDALLVGVDHVLLMGMGGSSLFPEVVANLWPRALGAPELVVLDTTDPGAIQRIGEQCPPDSTLHIAASKSGSTIETRSHLEWAWARNPDPARFAVITDPGSALGDLARERGFAQVFENRPDIGGRYSALSLFGVVPGLCVGADVDAILEGGIEALEQNGPEADPIINVALWLGAALAAGARAPASGRRDKLTIDLEPGTEVFGLWIEQLIAESTGKRGTGVVPVFGESLAAPEIYGDDRVFVEDDAFEAERVLLGAAGFPALAFTWGSSPHQIGNQVVTWELATALCGAALGINPFDQPDVAAAKAATARALAEGVPDIETTPIDDLLGLVGPGDYISIHAYVDPLDPVIDDVLLARAAMRDRLHVATTVGLGPRFLHSTGQLHKGGPPTGVFLQVVGDDAVDVPIPGQPFGFSTLKHAQAAGDLATLRERGLRAGRITADDLRAQIS